MRQTTHRTGVAISMMLMVMAAAALAMAAAARPTGQAGGGGHDAGAAPRPDIIPGDVDDDGDVDLDDYALFFECMHGPEIPETSAPCARAHFDLDPDIDMVDFAGFQDAFMETP